MFVACHTHHVYFSEIKVSSFGLIWHDAPNGNYQWMYIKCTLKIKPLAICQIVCNYHPFFEQDYRIRGSINLLKIVGFTQHAYE